MMTKYNFSISGNPVGKARHRDGKNGRKYTPAKTVEYQRRVLDIFHGHFGYPLPMRGPVCIFIEAIFEPPASANKADRAAMLYGNIYPIKKPDWDNIGKIITDALNGEAYDDDKQIISAHVIKRYGRTAQVNVQIEDSNETLS